MATTSEEAITYKTVPFVKRMTTSIRNSSLVAKSCLTLLRPDGPMDCSLPGSAVCGISQARLLCSGLPFPSPVGLPAPGTEHISPALAGGFFTSEPVGSPYEA